MNEALAKSNFQAIKKAFENGSITQSQFCKAAKEIDSLLSSEKNSIQKEEPGKTIKPQVVAIRKDVLIKSLQKPMRQVTAEITKSASDIVNTIETIKKSLENNRLE